MSLLEACTLAEKALGENLVWLADQLDIRIRQKDSDTLRKLAQLESAWKACVAALAPPPKIDRETAVRRLTARWNEQAERFPTMRAETPLDTYIKANLALVMRDNLLASYDAKSSHG